MRSLVQVLAIASWMVARAHAAEICGNGIDDDADGLADEGCYPTLTTGQCESPLSCGDAGMVSPSTGSLRYSLPPDVAPRVPYGPGIGFRRFYVSQYAPGASAPAYRKSLGERWGHTYATWIDAITGTPAKAIWHTPRGQDILFTKTSSDATWDNYTPQAGHHYKLFRRRIAAPNDYEIVTLTGDGYAFNGSGRLTEVRDSLVAPNRVLVAYDGSGNLSTVTDAQGKRRLLFGYTGTTITSVAFQILITGTWTTQHTTAYAYTAGNLTTVTIGGQTAYTHTYTSNYLTAIVDGDSKTLVTFSYDSATAGKVVRVDTPRGVIGYEYASSRTNCSGKTVLHFHKGNNTSCNVDADCGAGFLCGGKTGAGATGQCFRGARCLTVASPSEDVVTTVSAFGPGTEACEGACLDAAEYIWNSASGVLDLKAVKDPSNFYMVKQFDSNGMPIKIVYGDPDSDPTNANGERVLYLKYSSTFPGLVEETRHVSELDPQAPLCDGTNPDHPGCATTSNLYNTNGQLVTRVLTGKTLDATNAVTGFNSSTTYTYDAQGRLATVDGPLSGPQDLTTFQYWSSTDPLKDGFLQNVIRRKNAAPSDVLTTSALGYDFWGNATALQDPNLALTCLIFSTVRGHLTERRETMNGQTTCTAHTSDLVTTYVRDTALRLTQMTRPDGTCMFYEYDTRGRLLRTKRRDDCNAASAGDRQEYTYSADGLVIKTEVFNASNAVTKRQELTYYDSRQLEKMINPVNTAKWTGLVYDPRGMVNEVAAKDGTADLSKSQWTFNADGRVTDEKRYTAGSSFDTWNLLFDWIGTQKQVTDGDAKVTGSVRDDLGRVVRITSPDFNGNMTLRIYDEASRVVTVKEAYPANTQTHLFTYDGLGRLLTADYEGTCSGVNGFDIERIYDVVDTCPTGATCANIVGKLAYVKVKLMCQSTQADKSLDQVTYFGYDKAGRLTNEYITDDATRVAIQSYVWTKSGALQQVTLPSTAVIGWTARRPATPTPIASSTCGAPRPRRRSPPRRSGSLTGHCSATTNRTSALLARRRCAPRSATTSHTG